MTKDKDNSILPVAAKKKKKSESMRRAPVERDFELEKEGSLVPNDGVGIPDAEIRNDDNCLTFESFNLDERLLQAIGDLGWRIPTPIQSSSISLALSGRDIVARARTGSGKTAAFAIPLLQKLLQTKKSSSSDLFGVVIVPSKELATQIHQHFSELCKYCSYDVRIGNLSLQTSIASSSRPADIIVSTPSQLLKFVESGVLTLSLLQWLVIDEADLMFSFGYELEIKKLRNLLPKSYQAYLTSATMNQDVKALKKLISNNPVQLKLEESQLPSASQLSQYYIKCLDDDKFLLIYALLKLKLIRGKILIFVKNIDRGYKLKLFLQQFEINSCILNSELPANSRCHVVQQFNDGLYDIVIASDEKFVPENDQSEPARTKKKTVKDVESGVSRGIDFYRISNVVNFDFPCSVDSFIHRVGRTARGWNKGTALSLVSSKEAPILKEVEQALSNQGGSPLKQYQLDMNELDGFQYRAADALRAVTSTAIKEARLAEIREEALKSRKLLNFFKKNPNDLQVLRHDKALHSVRKQPHLAFTPDYIVPPALRSMVTSHVKGGKKRKKPKSKPTAFTKKRRADPLQTLTYESDGE